MRNFASIFSLFCLFAVQHSYASASRGYLVQNSEGEFSYLGITDAGDTVGFMLKSPMGDASDINQAKMFACMKKTKTHAILVDESTVRVCEKITCTI